MIYSYELETQLLAGLIKYQDRYAEIASFIDERDFWSESSKINRTIFTVVRQAIDNGEIIDEIVLSQRVKNLGVSFDDNINPSDYIESLSLKKISPDSIISVAKELKKFTIRREIAICGTEITKKMKAISPSSEYSAIIETADKLYNNQINLYESGTDQPQNIFDEMEDLIEERGNNPVDEFGFAGPHPKLQSIYGSLLRPGNITVIVARSGVGKTQFCMDFATKVSEKYSVPVLHFDNGEMSKEELIFRVCSAMTQVPMHLLESGNWRKAGPEIVERVRTTLQSLHQRFKKLYYYNVGGMNVDSQINVLKRFYYSKIGRGNPLIFSFDYIKTTSESNANKSEWQVVGEMVDKYKRCIQKDIKGDQGPCIAMITSVQSNRAGIVTNKNSANVTDDESIVSLSDRITQFSSHMFILRNKTFDELQTEAGYGTHKLINVKARHLGKDIAGAICPVKMADGSFKKNFVNLEIANFCVTEKGDLRDIVDSLGTNVTIKNDADDDVPELSTNQS
jgi:replicative DNA helicase